MLHFHKEGKKWAYSLINFNFCSWNEEVVSSKTSFFIFILMMIAPPGFKILLISLVKCNSAIILQYHNKSFDTSLTITGRIYITLDCLWVNGSVVKCDTLKCSFIIWWIILHGIKEMQLLRDVWIRNVWHHFE